MKKIVSLILALTMLSSTVFATSGLQNQLDTTKKDINSAKQELDGVKKDKELTLDDIDSLDKQIGSTEADIERLENEISTLEKNIVIAEENIKFSEEEYERKDLKRQDRIVAYYKCGSLSFWDTLFSSESITDFFYRYRLMEEIIEYDNGLLAELKADKEAIEEQKLALENSKVLCEEKKVAAEEKKLALGETKEVRVQYLAKLEQTEELLEASIDELQKKADELTAEINKLASSGTQYTGGTMTWPLPGFTYISSPFGNRLHPVLGVYKMHTGVDIAGAGCNGKNIVAAADGKVITAGWISGYGNTIMIDHGGGIVTLYAHAQKLLVKVGDQVKAGTPVSLVGMTGYATGPHLHFEVRKNGQYVNPLDGWISAK